LFLIFSPQIANNLAENPQSDAIQLANEISQFQHFSNNGMQLGATVNRIIKTSDLISWSLQIARGMEFLASKKVMDGICWCLIQLNYFFLTPPSTGSARRFGGPQCSFSRGRNCQSGRFRIGQANEKLPIQEK
jgi:hypothetical protein